MYHHELDIILHGLTQGIQFYQQTTILRYIVGSMDNESQILKRFLHEKVNVQREMLDKNSHNKTNTPKEIFRNV